MMTGGILQLVVYGPGAGIDNRCSKSCGEVSGAVLASGAGSGALGEQE
jgi:hypothetical protein